MNSIFLRFCLRRLFHSGGGASYSQSGEDRVVKFIFEALGIQKPTYLDIGAHDPVRYSNTYLFYEDGCNGVCVEPNPRLFSRLQHWRPRDVCLNVGIGAISREAVPFYELSSDTLSTFSESEAKRNVEKHGLQIERVIRIDIMTPGDIIQKYFQSSPDFVSLDVEGLELEILGAFDFSGARPVVICVETITYEKNGGGVKLTNVIEFLTNVGYMLYADTNINTIFVDRQKWIRTQ